MVEGGEADLLRLAKARRMNTDVRRAVFCVVMGASDYLDAFEKLVRLSLRPPMDKDVVAVVFDCCTREKVPFFAVLTGFFAAHISTMVKKQKQFFKCFCAGLESLLCAFSCETLLFLSVV